MCSGISPSEVHDLQIFSSTPQVAFNSADHIL